MYPFLRFIRDITIVANIPGTDPTREVSLNFSSEVQLTQTTVDGAETILFRKRNLEPAAATTFNSGNSFTTTYDFNTFWLDRSDYIVATIAGVPINEFTDISQTGPQGRIFRAEEGDEIRMKILFKSRRISIFPNNVVTTLTLTQTNDGSTFSEGFNTGFLFKRVL